MGDFFKEQGAKDKIGQWFELTESFIEWPEEKQLSFLVELSQKAGGIEQIIKLKASLDEASADEPMDAERIKKLRDIFKGKSSQELFEKYEQFRTAFSTAHRFILENCLSIFGEQAIYACPAQGALDVIRLANYGRSGDLIEFSECLAGHEEGDLLSRFLEEASLASGDTLDKTRQIYNLVAARIPRYRAPRFQRGENYLSFNKALQEQKACCFEKNALLVHALRQIGIDARLWGSDRHAFARIMTEEGVLEADVTTSNAFTLRKPGAELFFSLGMSFESRSDSEKYCLQRAKDIKEWTKAVFGQSVADSFEPEIEILPVALGDKEYEPIHYKAILKVKSSVEVEYVLWYWYDFEDDNSYSDLRQYIIDYANGEGKHPLYAAANEKCLITPESLKKVNPSYAKILFPKIIKPTKNYE